MIKKFKTLYLQARSIPPGMALQMALQAESDEERNFFAYIADMNLQRAQWEVIRAEENKRKDGE